MSGGCDREPCMEDAVFAETPLRRAARRVRDAVLAEEQARDERVKAEEALLALAREGSK